VHEARDDTVPLEDTAEHIVSAMFAPDHQVPQFTPAPTEANQSGSNGQTHYWQHQDQIDKNTSIRTHQQYAIILQEPTNHRRIDDMKYRLDKRLADLWGNSSIYNGICTERFGFTISDMFFSTCRQLAQGVSSMRCKSRHSRSISLTFHQEDMVYNSLLAFTAADAAINTDWSSRQAYSRQSLHYFAQAIAELRKRTAAVDERRAQGRNPNMPPVMFTIFLLAAYGVSGEEPGALQYRTDMSRYVRIVQRRLGAWWEL
jgi:hypothetical protein